MNFLLVPLLVPLFFFLPGYFFSRILFRNPDAFSAGERWFIPIAISVCFSAWLAFVLAEWGALSLLNVALVLIVLCAAMLFFARKHFSAWSLRGWKPDWIFLALLLLAVVLFARPAEYIVGNYDAGIYINTGALMARTGGIVSYDAQVAAMDEALGKQLFWDLPNPYLLHNQARLPGFFIADNAHGWVAPQFFHFYPAWLALWNALLGMRGGLFATPLLGILASVAFYFLVKTLYSKNLARLAFFLLLINVPQFWFARYPVAEMMMQFLLLTGFYACAHMTRRGKNETGMALVAGFGLGAVFLTRADAILLLAPLGGAAVWVMFARRWRRAYWFALGTFVVLLLHALAHLVVFAPSYLYFQYAHVLRMRNIDKLFPGELPTAAELFSRVEYLGLFAALFLLGAGALKVADALFQRARRRWGAQGRGFWRQYEKPVRVFAAVVIISVFLFAYFIAPAPQSALAYIGGVTSLDRSANLLKLGWYLAPIGIVLTMCGAALVTWRDLNRHNAIFFGAAALYAIFYIEELYSNPHYIYTTRHYIPLVIPLFILLAARALHAVWNLRGAFPIPMLARGASLGLLLVWLVYNLYVMGIVDPCGRQQCAAANSESANGAVMRIPFVRETISFGGARIEPFEKSIAGHTELGGAFSQIETLAQSMEPNAIVLMMAAPRDQPALIATPLHFIFGRDVFVVTADAPDGELLARAIDTWRAQGRQVILAFGTNGGRVTIPRYALEPLDIFQFDVPQWAFAYDVMPRVAWRVQLAYALYRATPRTAPNEYPFVLDFGGADFPYLVYGFMERAPNAQTRWIGALLSENRKLRDAAVISGVVRVPIQDARTNNLKLTLRARAPRDNVRLEIKNGNRVLSELVLDAEMKTYVVELKNARLDANAEGFLLELVSETTLDGEGRALGIELEMLRVER